MNGTGEAVARQRKALLELVQLDKSSVASAFPRILESVARALEIERVSFWRLAKDHSRIQCELIFQLSTGETSSGDELLASQFPRYFAAMLENAVIRADDALHDPRTSEFNEKYFRRHGISSLLDVPVWYRGQLAGVLCHEHVGEARAWTEYEVDFATSVGATLAVALEAEARHNAERRYELLTSAMQDLVWDWDLSSDQICWSDALFEGLRYRRDEVKDSLEWWKQNVHPHDRHRVLDSLDRHVEAGRGVWRDEYRFRRGDGTWAMIADQGVLERGPEGEALRMVGAMVDITEQRTLQSRVALSDRMASVGTLAAGVAHEINNPLTYVAANLNFGLKMTAGTSPKLKAALEDALRGVQRVQEIVRDLKTFSRPDDGAPAAVDVRSVIESALGIAGNEIAHRAQLVRDYVDVPPAVGNAARLGQVMLNLLINAVQAIPEGNADQHEIVVRTRRSSAGGVVIEVRDTGRGVPSDLLERVFDPFFTTKAVGEGTGLGLAICHSLISGMGGTITLENNPDRGITARVELAAATSSDANAAASDSRRAEPHKQRRGRVLIIDDVANVGISMQRLIGDAHEAEVMTSSKQALAALNQGARWDVMLCDLMMPELDGVDFVKAVEQLDASLLPRVIVMTGGAFTKKAREFLELWPHAKLNKPFDPDDMLAQVAQTMGRNA